MICYSNKININYINNFNHRNSPVPLICFGCNQPCVKPKFRCVAAIKQNLTLYCSAQCYSQNIRRKKPNTLCTVCLTTFYAKPKQVRKSKSGNVFCSQICANKFLGFISKKNKNCIACGNVMEKNQKYCSNRCQRNNEWEIYKQKIELDGSFKKENRGMARKYLIEKYGHMCSICSTTEWFGEKVPLVCDHINGNADDNTLINLRMVCANCNQLLPTYAGKNRGYGRTSIAKSKLPIKST